VASSDRTVPPELQRFVAKRMGATTYEVDSTLFVEPPAAPKGRAIAQCRLSSAAGRDDLER
jgi:hypothetical protein